MARAQRLFRVIGILAMGYLFSSFTAHAVVPLVHQPSWAQLSPQQKEILAPLAGEWDKLEDPRRVKWLGVAGRYPTMQPEEQQRIQRQMLIWVRLTPEERQQVREKYKSLKKAPPEKKETLKQKWEQYKELPEEEKLRLKQQAATSPAPLTKKAKAIVKGAQPVKPLSQTAVPLAAPTLVPTPIAPATPASPAATTPTQPSTTAIPVIEPAAATPVLPTPAINALTAPGTAAAPTTTGK
ncbi:MAG TPA: DUF3106 domain-containing protein [Rhodocyclaceae bacterium]|nr:DUF3106 domain-containing protein [Rhodocyclaceae bacterium]